MVAIIDMQYYQHLTDYFVKKSSDYEESPGDVLILWEYWIANNMMFHPH